MLSAAREAVADAQSRELLHRRLRMIGQRIESLCDTS
jgi:hypothetical protein